MKKLIFLVLFLFNTAYAANTYYVENNTGYAVQLTDSNTPPPQILIPSASEKILECPTNTCSLNFYFSANNEYTQFSWVEIIFNSPPSSIVKNYQNGYNLCLYANGNVLKITYENGGSCP